MIMADGYGWETFEVAAFEAGIVLSAAVFGIMANKLRKVQKQRNDALTELRELKLQAHSVRRVLEELPASNIVSRDKPDASGGVPASSKNGVRKRVESPQQGPQG